MKVLVTGGRNFKNYMFISDTLLKHHQQHGIDILIHGNAEGVDRLSDMWAKSVGVHTASVEALWNFYEDSAGFRRNYAMTLLKPDLIIAFPGGKGTASMVQLAHSDNIPVYEVVV